MARRIGAATATRAAVTICLMLASGLARYVLITATKSARLYD